MRPEIKFVFSVFEEQLGISLLLRASEGITNYYHGLIVLKLTYFNSFDMKSDDVCFPVLELVVTHSI